MYICIHIYIYIYITGVVYIHRYKYIGLYIGIACRSCIGALLKFRATRLHVQNRTVGGFQRSVVLV